MNSFINTISLISHFVVAFTFFFAGYLVGQKTVKNEVFRIIVAIGVIGVWIFRLIFSAFDTSIVVSVWEHLITGLIIYALWGTKEGGYFVGNALNKLSGGLMNGKKSN